jgi:hypothetical protein
MANAIDIPWVKFNNFIKREKIVVKFSQKVEEKTAKTDNHKDTKTQSFFLIFVLFVSL